MSISDEVEPYYPRHAETKPEDKGDIKTDTLRFCLKMIVHLNEGELIEKSAANILIPRILEALRK